MHDGNRSESAVTADRALGILIENLGLPNPEDPMPPGPWDPVIRGIDISVLGWGPHPQPWRDFRHGPHPDPWLTSHPGAGPYPDDFDLYGSLATPWRSVVLEVIRRRNPEVNDAIGGWGGGWQAVALNPQPLPPRWAFALAAASRMVMRVEMIGEMSRVGGVAEAAAKLVGHYVDDLCPPIPRPWPLPGPWPRPNWLVDVIDAPDLVVVGSVLSVASRQVADRDLAQALDEQAGRLAEEVVSRLG